MWNDINVVKLKNGSEEAESLVNVAMHTLSNLMKTQPILFYELVQKCRDRDHKFFWQTEEKLESMSLVSNWEIHDSMVNIVLSAVEWENLDMRLVSPLSKASEDLLDILDTKE